MNPNSISQFDDAQIEELLAAAQPEARCDLKQLTMNRIRCQTHREKRQLLVSSFLALVCFGLWLNVVLMLGISSASGIASTTIDSQHNFTDILDARKNLFDRLENP